MTVATRMGSQDVLEALTPLILQRGTPDYLRSDNGPFANVTRTVGVTWLTSSLNHCKPG